MGRPALELADIFRQHGPAYRDRHKLPLHQLKLMRAIETCRTAALGGHVEQCDQCNHIRVSYNSCRNRHCPKCQGKARTEWVEKRQAELLAVPYFHVVFTLPEPIAQLAYQNKALLYGLLFQAAAQTLLTIARDPKHLGAEIGFFAVLHTWGQNLHHHPHLHCVVPGGGLAPDHDRWIGCGRGFFLPVRVLSRLFRRLFLEALQQLFIKGKLQFFSELESLADPKAFTAYLQPLRQLEWVVYAKPPFGGPQQVLAYLGRYTHRVAISNSRLMELKDDQVSFRWKDYRHHNASKITTLEAQEFIRRFLLHSLPPNFQRIRFYGFLSNVKRAEKLALCRRLLTGDRTGLLPSIPQPIPDPSIDEICAPLCPVCGTGHMLRIEVVPPNSDPPTTPALDSS